MQTLKLQILRVGAVLALAAASTSAFAQSAEYRRGYDDGFAAGQRASRDDRGHGGNFGQVRIEEAQYGTRGAMCDARQAVRHEIERNGGVVVVGNHLCGDPAYNQEKRLNIVYRCGNDAAMRVVGRENETMRLSCRR